MTRTALIATDDTELDVLAELPATTAKGGRLLEGMVILDEFGTPFAIIDHRIGSAGPRTGAVDYLAEDLEAGGWFTLTRHANADVTVAAR